MKPGIYELTEDQYHADPAPVASLSHSIAKMLLTRSPLHAWAAHPKLGNTMERKDTAAMDAGTIIHKLILGKGAEIMQIDAKDWRTNAAKEARDAARAAGKTPVLAGDMEALNACAAAAIAQMREHPDLAEFFAPGISEAVMTWREGATWFRGMADRLANNPKAPIFDLKTTGMSAAPEAWERRLVNEYATQASFYRRGLRAIRGVSPGPMLFIVVETTAPYGVSVMTPSPSLMAYADADIDRAVSIWARCMETGKWPGYSRHTAHVELPGYLAMKQEMRQLQDEINEEYAS